MLYLQACFEVDEFNIINKLDFQTYLEKALSSSLI